jgi:hypothetical protein
MAGATPERAVVLGIPPKGPDNLGRVLPPVTSGLGDTPGLDLAGGVIAFTEAFISFFSALTAALPGFIHTPIYNIGHKE